MSKNNFVAQILMGHDYTIEQLSENPIILQVFDEVQKVHITYEVKMADGSQLPQNITAASVFGKTQTESNYGGSYSFDVTIPYGYTAQVFAKNENTGEVIDLTGKREDIVDLAEREARVVNNGFALGVEPVYIGVNQMDLEKGPSAMRVEATFYDDQIDSDRKITVELTKRKYEPYFDMHYAIDTENLRGRGSAGTLNEIGGNLWPNIITEDTWKWENGVFAKDPATLSGNDLVKYLSHWQKQPNGSYNLDFVFQTNQGNFIFNSLGINGEYIELPFVPQQIWNGNTLVQDNGEDAPGSITESIVEGARVTVRFVRIFNNETQRVFEIKITNARTNMVVTAGNLMMGLGGAAEYVAERTHGISNSHDEVGTYEYYSTSNEWVSADQGQVITTNNFRTNYGDADKYYANIRFKMLKGFEKPCYKWYSRLANRVEETNMDEMELVIPETNIAWSDVNNYLENNKLAPNYIYGPDEENFYYIRLVTLPDRANNNLLFGLQIIASSMKYIVRYFAGAANDDITNIPTVIENGVRIPADIIDMPQFDTDNHVWDEYTQKNDFINGVFMRRYDDNNNRFYDAEKRYSIIVDKDIPIDVTGTKEFVNWVVVDDQERPIIIDDAPITIEPSTAIKVTDYIPYAVPLGKEFGGNENNYYMIYIKGCWKNK